MGFFCAHIPYPNVKTFITLVVLTFLVYTPEALALFGHVAQERTRRIETEQKLDEQQHTNGTLHIVISVLSAGVVISLVAGAAIGSKTRKDHES